MHNPTSAPNRFSPSTTGVLVIGGTGFLGSAIVRQLAAERRTVHVLSRRPASHPEPIASGVRHYVGEATEARDLLGALENLTAVVCAFGTAYPAAANVHASEGSATPIEIMLSHLKGAKQAIDLTVISSGGTVYGESAEPSKETDPLRPTTAYGRLMADMEAKVLETRSGAAGVTRVLRIANAYGHSQRLDRDQGFLGHALAAARRGQPVQVYGDGSAVRDYVDVGDVARATSSLAGSSIDGAVNVGTGIGTSLLECLDLLETELGHPLDRHHVEARTCDLRTSVLDVQRLSGLLPWAPTDIAAGIRLLVRASKQAAEPRLAVPA